MQKALLFALILFGIDSKFAVTHSLQYVYSGSSEIPNLPEFMTVGVVDGEPFTYYDSNIHRQTTCTQRDSSSGMGDNGCGS